MDELRFFGIDVGAKKCHVTIMDVHGRVVTDFEFARSKEGFAQVEEHLRVGDILGVEACTYAYSVHDHFVAKGFTVWVGNPRKLRLITESDSKNDRKDSWIQADLMRMERFPRVYVPHPNTLALRDITRQLEEFGREGTRLKNQVRSLLERYGVNIPFEGQKLWSPQGLKWVATPRFNDERDVVLAVWVNVLRTLADGHLKLEEALARAAPKHPLLSVVMTLRGVDVYLGMLILMETGPITRFPQKESYRLFSGSAPRVRDSGGWSGQRTPARHVNRRLKWAFGLVAQNMVMADEPNPVKDYYEKQKKKVKGKKEERHRIALARARRKVCDIVYAVLRDGKPCRFADPENVARKQRKLRRLARGNTSAREKGAA